MKTLIVYYSFTQNNEMLARTLQKRLGCDILRIEELRTRTKWTFLLEMCPLRKPTIAYSLVSLLRYDQFIFVAPVWAGRIASTLRAFLKDQKNNIRFYGFITLCDGRPDQEQAIKKELSTLLFITPMKVTELGLNTMSPRRPKPHKPVTEADLKEFEPAISDFLECFYD